MNLMLLLKNAVLVLSKVSTKSFDLSCALTAKAEHFIWKAINRATQRYAHSVAFEV